MTDQAQHPSRAATGSNCQEEVPDDDPDKTSDDGPEAVIMKRVLFNPVDKGWSWMILISVFVIQVNCIGMLRSLGIFFVPIQVTFGVDVSAVSLVAGAQAAVFSVCGLVTMTLLIDKMSVRNVARLGSFLCFAGLSLSYFANTIAYYFICQSILCGLGLSMCFGPGFVLLGTYFNRRRALAVAVANSGGSVGTLLFPLVSRLLLEEYSLAGTYLLLGAIFAHSFVFAGFYTPPEEYQERLEAEPQDLEPRTSDVADVDVAELALLGSTTLLGGDVKQSAERRSHSSFTVSKSLRPLTRVKNWFRNVSWKPSLLSIGPSSRVTPKGACNGERAKGQENVADLEGKPGYQLLKVESQLTDVGEEDLVYHRPHSCQGSIGSIHSWDRAEHPTLRKNDIESVHFVEPDLSVERQRHSTADRQRHSTADMIPEIITVSAVDTAQCREEDGRVGSDQDVPVNGTAKRPAWFHTDKAVCSAGGDSPHAEAVRAAGGETKTQRSGHHLSTGSAPMLDPLTEDFRLRAFSEGCQGLRTKPLAVTEDGLQHVTRPHYLRSISEMRSLDEDQPTTSRTMRHKGTDSCVASQASVFSSFKRGTPSRRLTQYSMLYLSRETIFIPPQQDMQMVEVNELEVEEEEEWELSRMNFCHRWGLILVGIFFDLSLFKSLSFWLMIFFHFFGYLGMNMPAAFVPPLAQERGLDLEDAASLMIVLGCVDFVGRLLPGFMVHLGLLRPHTMVCVCYIINGVVFQLTAFFNSMASLMCMCAVNGFCAGCYVSMMQLITIDFVGLDHFPKAFGMVQMAVGFATAAFLPFLGALRDITGNYVMSFHVIGACTLLSSLLLLLAPLVKRHELGDEKVLQIKRSKL